MKFIKNKRGQSTVEYVLLVTAVLAVIIAFVSGSNGGFQVKLNATLNTAANEMNAEMYQLSQSHPHNPGSDQGIPTGYNVNPVK